MITLQEAENKFLIRKEWFYHHFYHKERDTEINECFLQKGRNIYLIKEKFERIMLHRKEVYDKARNYIYFLEEERPKHFYKKFTKFYKGVDYPTIVNTVKNRIHRVLLNKEPNFVNKQLYDFLFKLNAFMDVLYKEEYEKWLNK